MKKQMKHFILSLTFALVFGSTMYGQSIKLPVNENKERGKTVLQALADRKSTGEFSDRELSLEDLSDLLWAANGINRPEIGKKTAPSAQNAQEIDIYVCLKNGAYIYDAKEHALNFVSKGDFRMMGERKAGAVAAPCLLVLVAETSRYNAERNTKEHINNMSYVDGGIVSQNISVFCAGADIGTKPRAQMDRNGLKEALKLSDSQVLILNHPVGYFK